jgi:hypothetical protein
MMQTSLIQVNKSVLLLPSSTREHKTVCCTLNRLHLTGRTHGDPEPLTEDDFHGSSSMTGRTEHGVGA